MAAASANCPTGYSADFTFKWPGTVTGCNCKRATGDLNKYKLTSKIYAETCTSNMTLAGCPPVPSTPAVDMDMIPVDDTTKDNGQKVCVKRESGVTFVSTAANMKEDGTCSKGNPCGVQEKPLDHTPCVSKEVPVR